MLCLEWCYAESSPHYEPLNHIHRAPIVRQAIAPYPYRLGGCEPDIFYSAIVHVKPLPETRLVAASEEELRRFFAKHMAEANAEQKRLDEGACLSRREF